MISLYSKTPLARVFVSVFVAVALCVLGPKHLSAQNADERPSFAQLVRFVQNNLDDRGARWALSQVAFMAGNYDAARYHVKFLLRTSTSQNDVNTLTNALAEITAADPWNVELNFSLLPSTNVRRTTYNSEFETLLGVFTPAGGGNEESGIGLNVGADLSYGLGLSDNSLLTFRASVDHYIYDSSDLNQSSLLFAIRRDTFAARRNVSLEPYVSLRFDENQTLERRDVGLNFVTGWWLDDGAHITATAVIEDRNYLRNDTLSGPHGRLSLRYSYTLDERSRLSFSGSLARSEPQLDHLRYWEGQLSSDVTRRFEDVGTFGLFGRYTMRQYDDIFPATTIVREDATVALGLSFQPDYLEIFGSRPKISCQIESGTSNIALYEYNTTDCRFTFEQVF